MNKKPFIHLFRTLGAYYIFDVNTNAILSVEKETFHYLKSIMSENDRENNISFSEDELTRKGEWVKDVQQQGFLSSKRIKQIQHNFDPFLEGFLEHNMGNLILQVTQACNLRCKYCSYSGDYLNRTHGELSMSEEIAKKAIDFFINHSSEMPRLAFGFYGGEPFYNFPLLKNIIPYIKQKSRGKEYNFFITTNGTIMNEEIIRFLANYEVNLFISLDGPKEVHDQNRCFPSGRGSFETVMKNIKLIKKIVPEYANKKVNFSAVFNCDTSFCSRSKFFSDFEAIKDPLLLANSLNMYYLKEDRKTKLTPDNLQYFDDIEFEILKYMLYKNRRLEKSDFSKIIYGWEEADRAFMEEKRVIGSELPDNFHPSGPCVPGSKRLFVTVKGDLYPCERVSETSNACRLGSLETGIDIERARKFLNIGRLTEEECKNCWAARFCGACIACADNGHELDKKHKLNYCNDFKANAEAKLKKYCTFKEFDISTEKHYN